MKKIIISFVLINLLTILISRSLLYCLMITIIYESTIVFYLLRKSNRQKIDIDDFKAFTSAQAKAIEISKWMEGERLNYDPGQDYILKWIDSNAKQFKEDWDKSICSNCKKDCKYKNLPVCNNFIPDTNLINKHFK